MVSDNRDKHGGAPSIDLSEVPFQELVREQMRRLGVDPDRPPLDGTPRRVEESLVWLTREAENPPLSTRLLNGPARLVGAGNRRSGEKVICRLGRVRLVVPRSVPRSCRRLALRFTDAKGKRCCSPKSEAIRCVWRVGSRLCSS